MTESLFIHCITAPDDTYNAIRDNQTPEEQEMRVFLEEMWRKYKPYADTDFRQQIQYNFDSRFWEMYLACTLIDNELPISAEREKANRGPDILIDSPEGRVWIEAIAPTAGGEVNPDRVPEMLPNVVTTIQKDGILLRYRAAIEEKHNKYWKYREDGIVAPTDAYVIAIDSCRIPNAIANANWKDRPPYILEVVLPIERIWRFSRIEGAKDDYRFRGGITRESGAKVDTSVFLDPEYAGISAVICAYVSCGHMPSSMGGNYVFVHNPLASNPLSAGFLKVGREYVPSYTDDELVLTATDWD